MFEDAPSRIAADQDRPLPDIISQIKDSYAELRPAERRVADVVLADVSFSVDASNAEIARRAEVSEPTVTRFCRAIGCEGVRDFKLKLAQSVVVGAALPDPARASARVCRQRLPDVERGLRRGPNALSAVERSIDPSDVVRAAELVASAHQVAVFGLGGSSSALALETQYRLFRYGVVVAAHSDPYIMRMTASTLNRTTSSSPSPPPAGAAKSSRPSNSPVTIAPRPSASPRLTPTSRGSATSHSRSTSPNIPIR